MLKLLWPLLLLPLLAPRLAAPQPKWRVALGRPVTAAPVLTPAGALVIGLEGLAVRALDARTGRPLWSSSTPDPPRALCATTRGPALVIVGTMTFDRDRVWGPLIALDAATGRQRWIFREPGAFPDPAVQAPDGRLLVTSFYLDTMWFADTLHALDPASGRELWKTQGLEASINAFACPPDGRTFVTGFQLAKEGTRLHRLDPNGREDWSMTIRRDSFAYAPLALDASGLVFTGGEHHELLAIKPGQDVLWMCRLARHNAAWARVIGADRLVVCSFGEGKRALDGIDLARRRVVWTNGDRRWAAPLRETGDTLLCGEVGAPALHALSARDGRALWSLALPDLPVGVDVAADGTIFVACRNGEVLALTP